MQNPPPQPPTPCCSPSPSHQWSTPDPHQQPGDEPVSHQELSADLTLLWLQQQQRARSHGSSRSLFPQRTSWSFKIHLWIWGFSHVLIDYGAASAAQAALIEQMRCGWVIIRFILIFVDYSCMQTLPLACLLSWVGRQRSKSLISVESNETRTHSHVSAFPSSVKGWLGRCHTPGFVVFTCDAFNLNHKKRQIKLRQKLKPRLNPQIVLK